MEAVVEDSLLPWRGGRRQDHLRGLQRRLVPVQPQCRKARAHPSRAEGAQPLLRAVSAMLHGDGYQVSARVAARVSCPGFLPLSLIQQ